MGQLVDHVANAVGVIYEPTKIRRKAKAEAEALILEKKAQLLSESISERAKVRVEIEQIRNQANIEGILEKSFKFLPDNKNVQASEDWLAEFFDRSKNVSNEEIQEAWAKVLAQECSMKGSFNYDALDLLKRFTLDDAAIFEKFFSSTFKCNDEFFLFEYADRPFNSYTIFDDVGMLMNDVSRLIEIGAVVKQEFSNFITSKETKLIHGDDEYSLKLVLNRHAGVEFINNYFYVYQLTTAGKQLSKIISVEKNKKFVNFAFNCLAHGGLCADKK
ncbi:DUF2806 domain-containing protein [Alteromonas stellipolaris]|uniref:DUF2806 domain-containing protein n=1 Tax=Alteromonas stellipolaris TaxID=233316 RepID=UPI001D635571|nr:DUF2806 domain-containing protein [Alteromonas stellipolaris]MBZ2162463.1 DUF2806 domain-containing protein [Alteromonas stellipolaris]